MIILNDFVDNVYCINLKKRRNRWSSVSEQFKKHNIQVERIEGIDGNKIKNNPFPLKGQFGLLETYKILLTDAINKKHKKICIFEDDIVLCDDFNNRLNDYVEKVPSDWDIMFLGYNTFNCSLPQKKSEFIFKINDSKGCFSIILNNKKKLFQKLLENINSNKNSIDIEISNLLNKYNGYCYFPFFVKISDSISDINFVNEEIEFENVINKYYSSYMKSYFGNTYLEKNGYCDIIIDTKLAPDFKTDFDNILKSNNFEIFFRNNKIYDSSENKKISYDYEFFYIGEKKYEYRGLRIKKIIRD